MSAEGGTGVTPLYCMHPSLCHTALGFIKGFANDSKVPPASPALHSLAQRPWKQHISHCATTGPGRWSALQGRVAVCPRDWEATTECLCFLLASFLPLGWLLRWEKRGELRNRPPTVGQAPDTIPTSCTGYPQCIAEALTGCSWGAQLSFTAHLYRGNNRPDLVNCFVKYPFCGPMPAQMLLWTLERHNLVLTAPWSLSLLQPCR